MLMESTIDNDPDSMIDEEQMKRPRSTGDSHLWLHPRRAAAPISGQGKSSPNLSGSGGSSMTSQSRTCHLSGMSTIPHQERVNAAFSSTNGSTAAERASRLRSTLGMPGERTTERISPSPLSRRSRLQTSGSTPNMMPSRNLEGDSTSSLGSQGSGESLGAHANSNVVMQLAQRSNGRTIKAVLSKLRDMTGSDESTASEVGVAMSVDLPRPPSDDMLLLAQCASADTYYKVIITKYQGISTIIKIMDMYQDQLDIQVYALSILAHLPDKASIHQHGGVPACIRTMAIFSNSIEVLSSGFHMLKMQASVLSKESHDCLRSLCTVVETARQKYLTQVGKDGLICVERFLNTYQIDPTCRSYSLN